MSVREGYKQTEIGVIPEEWEVVRLGQVLKLKGGNAFKSEDFIDSGIPVLKISNINKNGQIDLSNCVYVNEKNNYTPFLLSPKDIVVAMSGATTGKIGQVKAENLPLYLNQRVGKFEIIKKNQLNNDYLYFNVTSNDFLDKLLVNAIGGAQPNISSKQIEDLQIPLPPLPEQQKITEILSTVDQKIESIDTTIEETKILKRGLMQRLLSEGIGHSEFKESEIGRIPAGWKVVELGEVAKLNKKKYTPTETETIKYISLEHINQDNGTINGIGSSDEALSIKNCFDTGDILFGKLRPYLRKFYLSGFSGVCSTEILAIQTQKNILNTFLFKIIQTEEFINHSVSKVFGTKMPRTSWDILKEFKLALPPLEEQKQIAEILSSTDEKLESLRAKKETFETLKKGLMQKLLSGEVRV